MRASGDSSTLKIHRGRRLFNRLVPFCAVITRQEWRKVEDTREVSCKRCRKIEQSRNPGSC
jgi:hypothetical protein